jgi:NAD(P)-dependent dehydrogenase (short-subunit alcohol dehydrogenase family)
MANALVTGTSTGIGEACARRLAELGWTVYAGVRRGEDADRLKTSVSGDIRPVMLDVTKRDDIGRVIDEINRETAGHGLQALVNNAGIGYGGPFEYIAEEEWRMTFEVNVFGVVALTLAAIPLLRTGEGAVIYIGSVGGRVAAPGLGPYSASKFAIEALAESQRIEFKRSNTPIRVALIEPGEVKTAIWEKGNNDLANFEARVDEAGRRRYTWLLDQTRGFLDEGQAKGVTPDKVADAMEHALAAKRPKARYLVGPDAKMMGNVFPRLPDRLKDPIAVIASKRWERRGRKLARP